MTHTINRDVTFSSFYCSHNSSLNSIIIGSIQGGALPGATTTMSKSLIRAEKSIFSCKSKFGIILDVPERQSRESSSTNELAACSISSKSNSSEVVGNTDINLLVTTMVSASVDFILVDSLVIVWCRILRLFCGG